MSTLAKGGMRLSGPSRSWLGFLLVSFAVVGLTGLFATFAAPLPLERLAAREALFDAAALAASEPDPGAALDRLRASLDDGGPGLRPGPDLPARVAAARQAAREALLHEADVVARRLRWLVSVVTVMAAAFGAACYQAGAGRAGPGTSGEQS